MNQSLSYEFAAVIPAVQEQGLDVSLCTIQEPSGIFEAGGQPDLNYVNMAGLVNIRCTHAPIGRGTLMVTANEDQTVQDVLATNTEHVTLMGYYPQINAALGQRVIMDGVIYDLTGAESDSQSQMTRLGIRLAKV